MTNSKAKQIYNNNNNIIWAEHNNSKPSITKKLFKWDFTTNINSHVNEKSFLKNFSNESHLKTLLANVLMLGLSMGLD